MFTTDAVIKTDVANALHLADVDTLPDGWDGIVPKAHAKAYNQIVRALLARGFTKTTIDTWTGGEEFERDLSLFWALTEGGGLANYDNKFIDKLDRREELKTVVLDVGGQVQPSDQIGTGQLNQTGGTFQYTVNPGTGDITKTKW